MLFAQNPATVRKEIENRFLDMRGERQDYLDHWRDIADHMNPKIGKALYRAQRKGKKYNNKRTEYSKIYNNTAVIAARTMAQGLMSGTMSPNDPWFVFGAGKKYEDDYNVRRAMHHDTDLARAILSSGNFYTQADMLTTQLVHFNTGLMYFFPDFEDVVRFYTADIGEYFLGLDERMNVSTAYREIIMTCRKMIAEFGRENVSQRVRTAYDNGNYSQEFEIVHVCDTNTFDDIASIEGLKFPYVSIYYEKYVDKKTEKDKLLRIIGHEIKPFVSPRTTVVGDEIYGSGPSDMALGDAKSLQFYELERADIVKKMSKPPLAATPGLKNEIISQKAGAVSFGDMVAGSGSSIRPLYTIAPDLNGIDSQMQRLENRIDRAFFADIFLMIAQDNRSRTSATEIAIKEEEKLLMLGPIIERDAKETKSPVLKAVRHYASKAGLTAPLPEEVDDIEIEYVSKLAQALKVIETTKIERMFGFTGNLVQQFPESRHKVNVNAAIDKYGQSINVDPDILYSDDEANEKAEAEAQAAQQQQAIEQAPQAASAAKLLSETDTRDPNSLLSVIAG